LYPISITSAAWSFIPSPAFLFIIFQAFIFNPTKKTQGKIIFSTLITSAIISISIFFALMLDDIVISYDVLLFFAVSAFRTAIY